MNSPQAFGLSPLQNSGKLASLRVELATFNGQQKRQRSFPARQDIMSTLNALMAGTLMERRNGQIKAILELRIKNNLAAATPTNTKLAAEVRQINSLRRHRCRKSFSAWEYSLALHRQKKKGLPLYPPHLPETELHRVGGLGMGLRRLGLDDLGVLGCWDLPQSSDDGGGQSPDISLRDSLGYGYL